MQDYSYNFIVDFLRLPIIIINEQYIYLSITFPHNNLSEYQVLLKMIRI